MNFGFALAIQVVGHLNDDGLIGKKLYIIRRIRGHREPELPQNVGTYRNGRYLGGGGEPRHEQNDQD